jgi:hypothetical protein
LDIAPDGTIRQARAKLTGTDVPVTITLPSYGPQQITVPSPAKRVELSAIRDLYGKLTGTG